MPTVKRAFATGLTVEGVLQENKKMEMGLGADQCCYVCKRRAGQESAVVSIGDSPEDGVGLVNLPIKLSPYHRKLDLGEGRNVELIYLLCMECRLLIGKEE
jgi:hypothetical protein